MIFLLYHPTTFCAARHNGRLLANEAGLKGMSFDALSRFHNLSRFIGGW